MFIENGSKNKTQEVEITVDAPGKSEARVTAKSALRKKYKNLSGIAIRKIQPCLT